MGLTHDMLVLVQFLLMAGGWSAKTQARLERLEAYLIERFNR